MQYRIYNNWPKEGVKFIDFTPSMLDKESFQEIIDKLSALVPNDIDYIVSPEARGFIWGATVAAKLNKGFIPLRKKGKLPDAAIMSSYNYNTEYSTSTLEIPKCYINKARCFFIDDVLATAGTYKSAKVLIDTLDATLLGGAVIYNVGLKDIMKIKHLYSEETLPKE